MIPRSPVSAGSLRQSGRVRSSSFATRGSETMAPALAQPAPDDTRSSPGGDLAVLRLARHLEQGHVALRATGSCLSGPIDVAAHPVSVPRGEGQRSRWCSVPTAVDSSRESSRGT